MAPSKFNSPQTLSLHPRKNNMYNLIDYVIARLAESSTWRGLILLVSSAGITIDPDQSGAIIAAGLGLIGLINVFRKSSSK